jgi:hypothetical protein
MPPLAVGTPASTVLPAPVTAAAVRPTLNGSPTAMFGAVQAALVEYRQPVSAGSGCLTPTGQHCLYSLLIIYADPAHLAAIVDSVQLHH